jgi:hypothetical protein
MAHTLFEGITAFSTEEVAEVPVLTKCDSMLAHDRSLAMLAFWGIDLVPVKMTEVAKSSITIFSPRLAIYFW